MILWENIDRLQTFQELAQLNNKWNFYLSGCNIKGDTGLQEKQNLGLAQALVRPYILCKIEFLNPCDTLKFLVHRDLATVNHAMPFE